MPTVTKLVSDSIAFSCAAQIMQADTREIRAVVNIMNLYSPDLYMDIHVTDGADYQ
jgi:hypothetical protein